MASQIFKVFSRSLHASCVKRTAAGAGGFEKVEYSKVENVNQTSRPTSESSSKESKLSLY